MIILRFIIVSILLCASGNSQQRKIKSDIIEINNLSLDYLFYLPEDYKNDKDKKWPTILFLHGMGERGDDLELVKIHGVPKIVDSKKDFQFIAISPQCPIDFVWRDEEMLIALESLLLKIIKNFRVDKSRLYVTGLSMGGRGTWAIAAYRPDLFAAAAPICGGGDPTTASRLTKLPFWVFQGALDEVHFPKESEIMIKSLKNKGGEVRYTLYPELHHDSWTITYDNSELYKWFLSKSNN
ncbi:MAG: prolyl oligopeptidase family serine peptidase [Candidatus Marinimicrobia bacterium]|nr:prolyl oligopeptidase family serine peptidase [Candidatus Neomarinimicrobiota bacterium]